jgi:hypothetical protein
MLLSYNNKNMLQAGLVIAGDGLVPAYCCNHHANCVVYHQFLTAVVCVCALACMLAGDHARVSDIVSEVERRDLRAATARLQQQQQPEQEADQEAEQEQQ